MCNALYALVNNGSHNVTESDKLAIISHIINHL